MASTAPTQPGFWDRVDERLGVGALRYPVPRHANSADATEVLGSVSRTALTATAVVPRIERPDLQLRRLDIRHRCLIS